MSLRAHLLHGAHYRSLALVDVVALAPWGSPFFLLVAENASVFAQLPPELHEALVRAYIGGAAHRRLRPESLDLLVAPWLGREGQAAFYRQIAQADQRYTDEIEPRYAAIDLSRAGDVGHRRHVDPGRPRAPPRRADPRRGGFASSRKPVT